MKQEPNENHGYQDFVSFGERFDCNFSIATGLLAALIITGIIMLATFQTFPFDKLMKLFDYTVYHHSYIERPKEGSDYV